MNAAPPAMLVGRRPTASAAVPPSSAPMRAPSVTTPTTNPCAAGSRWNSGMMKSSAPEITPVSKPKRRPPSAAISVMSVAYGTALLPGADRAEVSGPSETRARLVAMVGVLPRIPLVERVGGLISREQLSCRTAHLAGSVGEDGAVAQPTPRGTRVAHRDEGRARAPRDRRAARAERLDG